MFLVVANNVVPEETNVVAGENQDFGLVRNVLQHVSIVKSEKNLKIQEIIILKLGKKKESKKITKLERRKKL